MTADTPEALNAELLARIVELEQELVELRARDRSGKPNLPNVDEIKRVRRAAYEALQGHAGGREGEQAGAIAAEFLRVFDALAAAAKR